MINGNSQRIFETVFLSYKQHSALSAFGPITSLFALYFVQLDKKTEIKLLRTIQT